MKPIAYLLLILVSFASCSKDNSDGPTTPPETMYFPPVSGNFTWETTSLSSLGWKQNAVQPLKDFLAANNTKSFMILVNGRIVMEEYFNGHNASTEWEWNSAGKTLVATTTGLAAQDLYNLSQYGKKYGKIWHPGPEQRKMEYRAGRE